MMILDEKKLIDTLIKIKQDLDSKVTLEVNELDKKKTALVNVDIINGFCKCGSLYSPRVEKKINTIYDVNKKMEGFKKIFFRDCHNDNSKEFLEYPVHCIDNEESDIVDELQEFIKKDSKVFNKNSINGFFSEGFKDWFLTSGIDTFIVIGDCTDICVLTFVLSLKSYCNQHNISINVIVLIEAVETFDLDITFHDGDLMNMFALYNMQLNGAKLYKNIS